MGVVSQNWQRSANSSSFGFKLAGLERDWLKIKISNVYCRFAPHRHSSSTASDPPAPDRRASARDRPQRKMPTDSVLSLRFKPPKAGPGRPLTATDAGL